MVIVRESSRKLAEVDDPIILCFFEDELSFTKDFDALDKKYSNVISSAIEQNLFKGSDSQILPLYLNRVILLGFGKKEKAELRKIASTLAGAMRAIRGLDIKKASIHLDTLQSKKYDYTNLLEKAAIAIRLGLYQYNHFKTRDLDKIKAVDVVSLLVEKDRLAQAKKIIDKTAILADAVLKTRDLVNTPPNIATPEYAADYASKLAKNARIKCTIIDEKQLKKLGMNCYVAVGQASTNPARMVILEYNGAGKEKPIILVGKGITFDTGGINTKPQPSMLTMKDDKAGACSVMHVIEACARLQLKVNVIGIGAFAENAVSGNAYKPDDVLRSYSGITVEVLHSDAEGRMVLCDALSYAIDKYNPKEIVDIATLTGAAIVATGYLASPILGNDQKLIDELKESGEQSFDRLWQLPLWDEHEEIIKSDIADIKHVAADMDAGTIVGAVFLKQFVKETNWAHIDIAATVMSKADKGFRVKGATGFSVLLLLDYLMKKK